MHIYNSIPLLSDSTAVALGLFDGIHKGHSEVINSMLLSEYTATVFSFQYGEENISKPDFSYLLSPSLKEKILYSMGIVNFVCPLFSEIKDLEPNEFLENILKKSLNAKALFCGEDYKFGKNAKGDINILKAFCDENNISLTVVPDILVDGEKISSTRIRNALKNGDISLVNNLLGRYYQIDFTVTNGVKLGRKMGFPTINQVFPENYCLLKYGVYLTVAEIDGKEYYGVTNIGVKPTVSDNSSPSAETTLIDFDGDLYGKKVPLSFISFLREEKKFSSVEELKIQIEKDVNKAKDLTK